MELSTKINALSSVSGREKQLLIKYAPPVLTALLVLWVASKFVDLTWLLLDRPSYDATPAAVTEVQIVRPPETAQAVESIQAAHLFGQYVEPPDPGAGSARQESDEPTEIIDPADLTLKGTVASTTDNNGLAIIEYRGEDKVFTVGDIIAPGFELKRVLSQEIHVINAGTTKKILLLKTGDGNSRPARATPAAARRDTRPSNNRSVRAGGVSLPTKLGDLLRPQPVFQDGKQLGYRVYPGRKREQFKALGLKPGDLVTEINGTPLSDPSRGLEIFRSLNESTQVSVSIQRNGAQTSLVLDTTQLTSGNDE